MLEQLIKCPIIKKFYGGKGSLKLQKQSLIIQLSISE